MSEELLTEAESVSGGWESVHGKRDGDDRQSGRTEAVRRLLEREEQMLVLFSGDVRLNYVPDESSEHFELLPKEQKVIVPLLFFQQMGAGALPSGKPGEKSGTTFGISETRLLWHLYETLALYPDWQRHPERYLNRAETFRPEAEEMTRYFLRKVQKCGLQDDKAFQPSLVFFSAQNEILDFLEDMDRYAAALTVQEYAPVYQNPEVRQDIADMLLWEDLFPSENEKTRTRKNLAGSFLMEEFLGENSGAGTWADDRMNSGGALLWEGEVRRILEEKVCGKNRFSFLREQLISIIDRHQGIEARDPLIRTFLLPEFLRLWKGDIDRMQLSRTIEEDSDGQGSRKRMKPGRKFPDMDRSEKEKMLRELDEEQKKARRTAAAQLSGIMDLTSFGVTDEDLRLFSHYEAKVRPQREQMRQFWRRLIGEAFREENVKIEGMPKGKLDVPLLIDSWPSFTEAQQKQNYRGLTIFDSLELRKQTKKLPQLLDISFAIDNSGSMRSGKLPYAREALAIVLLSLQDFQEYLQKNASLTHQKIDVRTETWLFGTGCRRVLSFDDRNRKRQADTILSVTRLLGDGGSTDDGQCLKEILESITPEEIREMESGRRIHLIFEVTDGASSFPGSTKDAVEKLQKKHVHVQAIEIGPKSDQEAQRIFQYVFSENGIFLGEQTSLLPQTLMQAMKTQMTEIFKT